MRAASILKRAGAGLAVIVAGLFLIHLWPDEEPLPETKLYLDLLDPATTPKSWFLGAIGFQSNGDIFAAGDRIVAEFRRAGRVTREPHLLSDHTLLEHYLALYTASDFAHVLPPATNIPMPRFTEIFAAQELLHASLLGEADVLKALQRLDQDLEYWRRVLAGTNTFASKMAAIRCASQALVLRGKLLERPDADALGSLPPVPALSAAERSMRDAIHFEIGTDYMVIHEPSQTIVRSLKPGPGSFVLPLKPHATFNRHLQNHAPILAMAELPAAEFARVHAAAPPLLHAVTWRDLILNGKGVWLLSQIDATGLFGQYISAAHELAASIEQINDQQQSLM